MDSKIIDWLKILQILNPVETFQKWDTQVSWIMAPGIKLYKNYLW